MLQRLDIVDLFARDASANGFENFECRLHANVGGDQHLFELIQQLVVDLLRGKDGVESFRKRVACCGDCAFEPRGNSCSSAASCACNSSIERLRPSTEV